MTVDSTKGSTKDVVKHPVRQPLVLGNWKMNMVRDEARQLALQLTQELASPLPAAVGVAPTFLCIDVVREALEGSAVSLCAQNCFWENSGAFTGELGPAMLQDAGVSAVIVGHSERREDLGESDAWIAKKTRAVVEAGLIAVLCVGETLEERESGKTSNKLLRQVEQALGTLDAEALAKVVIAYEPIWAIGTGKTAAPEDAQAVHQELRQWLHQEHGQAVAEKTRILYGGSVKPDNAKALLSHPDVDGALVGGASLEASSFAAIVRAAG